MEVEGGRRDHGAEGEWGMKEARLVAARLWHQGNRESLSGADAVFNYYTVLVLYALRATF